MDKQKTVVILVAPAIYALIGMLAGWLSDWNRDIIYATFFGGIVGLGLAFGAWVVSTNPDMAPRFSRLKDPGDRQSPSQPDDEN
jgi:hypothetical protein